MGRLTALDTALCIADGMIGLEEGIKLHLTSNHYPPVAKEWHQIAIDIVKEARAGTLDWDRKVTNPLNGREMSIHEIVEGLHLDCFMHTGEDDG